MAEIEVKKASEKLYQQYYLAGLLDGDGSFQIVKQISHRNSAGYSIVVQICSTNKSHLEDIKSMFGGSLNIGIKKKDCKQIWFLRWYGNNARNLIEEIVDKLLLKKKQAEILSVFPLEKGKLLSEEEKALRESLYLYLRKLNKRGE